jgi:hypothetical protein
MSYLTELRKKPKHVRDNIAFVLAGVATLPVMAYLVFAVHGPKVTSGITETDQTDTKIFETFTNQIKEQVASVRESTTATTSLETKKYPSTVERGPLNAVPVENPNQNEASSGTVAASSSVETSLNGSPEAR